MKVYRLNRCILLYIQLCHCQRKDATKTSYGAAGASVSVSPLRQAVFEIATYILIYLLLPTLLHYSPLEGVNEKE